MGVYAHERNKMGIEQYLAKGFKKRIVGKIDTSFRRKKRYLKLGIKISKTKFRKNKRKYLNRIPRSYKIYIKSPYWTKRKNSFYKKYGKFCLICKGSYSIQLHHAFYGNYGNEADTDLIPLCVEHHARIHQLIGKVKRDMRKETLEAIEIMEYEQKHISLLTIT